MNRLNFNKATIKKFTFACYNRCYAAVLFFLFLLLAARYQIILLNHLEWGDESETIVTTKMMAAGLRLYDEIFNHHGPLTFLPGLALESIGNFQIAAHRLCVVLFQLATLASIYFSPLLRQRTVKLLYTSFAGSIFLLLLPSFYGHMYKYQTFAGLLLIAVLAQYTLPSIYFNRSPQLFRIAIGNFLIGSLVFLSISYLPLAILLFLASLRRTCLKTALISALTAVLLNLLFLINIASTEGYLAFHIYMNLKILPQFSDHFGMFNFLAIAIKSALKDSTSILILLIGGVSAYKLSKSEGPIPWRTLFLTAGIGTLLIRGWNFHALPYIYSSLTFPLILLANRSSLLANKKTKIAIAALTAISFIKLSATLPSDIARFEKYRINYQTEFSKIVKNLTQPEDKIVAYTFRNFEYIASNRLPASGNFFYLPWQKKYNENPKYGVKIDTCEQLNRYKPKVMLIDKWSEWGKHTWDSYGQCIQQLADKYYNKVPSRPYYIRNDLKSDRTELLIKNILNQ